MKDRKHWHYLFVLFIGSTVGGALSAHFWPDAVASAAAPHSRVIRAEKFELVAPDGTQRGLMQVTPRGMAALSLYDAAGKSRAEFKVMADGSSSAVAFYDSMGRRRVVVGESRDGLGGIGLYSAKGIQIGGLSATQDGHSSLTLYDLSGKARAGLGLPASGQPALALFDQNGRDRAQLYLKSDGSPGLALADANGKTFSGLPATSPAAPQQ